MATMRRGSYAFLGLIVLGLTWAATPAAAEWNTDLYGGAAWLPSSDLHVHAQNDGNETRLTIFNLDTDTGFIVGLRNGYWLESLPYLGFDFDLFYTQAPVPSQTTTGTGSFTGKFLGKPISVNGEGVASIPDATLPLFGFAPEIRGRWPLAVDDQFPTGRWQPYISAGPTWAFSLNDSHPTVEIGGKVGAGVAFNVTDLVAVFAEYRYTFYPNFELTDHHVSYKMDIDTHAFVLGASFRF
jgi:opacity protein-like surface antigen